MKLLVGGNIGGTKTAVVVGTTRGGTEGDSTCVSILSRAAFPTASPWQECVSIVTQTARELLAQAGPGRCPVQGIGVSCGGPPDSRAGLVLSPPSLQGWDRVPNTRVLSESLGAPALLQNDANACALAEWMYGAGRGCRTMVFLTFCTGMGGGIAKLAQAMVGAALGRGDPNARAIPAESGRRLGQGVAVRIDALNPERIVIGSISARCRAYLQPSMENAIRAEALAPAARACEIVPAALGESLGDYAALAVAARAGGAA